MSLKLATLQCGVDYYLIFAIISTIIFSLKVIQELKREGFKAPWYMFCSLSLGLIICGLAYPIVWGAYLHYHYKKAKRHRG